VQIYVVDEDPKQVAIDCMKGSLIIYDGSLYIKKVDGDDTSVAKLIEDN
jgi:hypothetical protein